MLAEAQLEIPKEFQDYRLRFWHPRLGLGRITVAALVPKKPKPLQYIPFAISWCSPLDSFQKVRGRGQAVQRLRRLLLVCGDLGEHITLPINHAAIFVDPDQPAQSLQDLLEKLVSEALNLFPTPSWVPKPSPNGRVMVLSPSDSGPIQLEVC